ncbi:MAG: YjbQ family protein [Deltaproteobacteria bacterium]|nr:YjbQ family protein [Deltaproteobacteria bacterium]
MADCQIHEITKECEDFVREIGGQKGALTVAVKGSTASISTIEYEQGLISDVPEILDKLIPKGSYHHDETWHDGNGHSHLRSTFIGTSKTFPVIERKIYLGTWQQIIMIDFDNKQRQREIALHFVGE